MAFTFFGNQLATANQAGTKLLAAVGSAEYTVFSSKQ
jgi:hypothetical protein